MDKFPNQRNNRSKNHFSPEQLTNDGLAEQGELFISQIGKLGISSSIATNPENEKRRIKEGLITLDKLQPLVSPDQFTRFTKQYEALGGDGQALIVVYKDITKTDEEFAESGVSISDSASQDYFNSRRGQESGEITYRVSIISTYVSKRTSYNLKGETGRLIALRKKLAESTGGEQNPVDILPEFNALSTAIINLKKENRLNEILDGDDYLWLWMKETGYNNKNRLTALCMSVYSRYDDIRIEMNDAEYSDDNGGVLIASPSEELSI